MLHLKKKEREREKEKKLKLSVQTLVSKYNFPIKEPRVLGEVVARAGRGKIHGEYFVGPRKSGKDTHKKDGSTSRGNRNQPERAPNGQRQNNLSNKINNKTLHYRPKNK